MDVPYPTVRWTTPTNRPESPRKRTRSKRPDAATLTNAKKVVKTRTKSGVSARSSDGAQALGAGPSQSHIPSVHSATPETATTSEYTPYNTFLSPPLQCTGPDATTIRPHPLSGSSNVFEPACGPQIRLDGPYANLSNYAELSQKPIVAGGCDSDAAEISRPDAIPGLSNSYAFS